MSTRTGSRTPQRAERPRVVVVGGGFGGLYAARALAGAPVDVTLIDRRNHHLFHPLLYQVATAALSPAEIAAPIRHILHRQRNAEVLLAEVTDVDTDGRTVLLGDGRELEYDYLVVGGGPTGVEMAGAFAGIAHHTLTRDFRHVDPSSARVLLLEGGPRLLPAYPQSLSESARQQLKRLGVEVRLGAMMTRIESDAVWTGRARIGTRNVVWAAGVAASPLGKRLSGTPAWLAWLFVHIVFLIGFRNRLLVLVQWAWSYLTWQRGARLITGWRGSESSPEDSPREVGPTEPEPTGVTPARPAVRSC